MHGVAVCVCLSVITVFLDGNNRPWKCFYSSFGNKRERGGYDFVASPITAFSLLRTIFHVSQIWPISQPQPTVNEAGTVVVAQLIKCSLQTSEGGGSNLVTSNFLLSIDLVLIVQKRRTQRIKLSNYFKHCIVRWNRCTIWLVLLDS